MCKYIAKYLFFLSVIAGAVSAYAIPGDSIHVMSHNKVFVVTDPTKGENSYRSWSEFPTQQTSYRKAILYVTYQCPDNLHCGEWDYIDKIVLRKSGGLKADTLNYEIARMISPYGWRFGSDWNFTWHLDITDFAPLLHDSVEIDFIHTGYESNKDRGWLVTLDFKLTEGIPAMQQTGIKKLWNGSFPYGDTLQSIEDFLTPIKFKAKDNYDIARMRILQTGHGMDDLENCAEFCAKYRDVIIDNKIIDHKKIWRKCGDNPLYPQAGTWIFDRANWCPGAMVFPDIYDIELAGKKSHTVDINMEPYVNHSKPSANYYFSSFLFFLKEPWAVNDVSVEEIISPNNSDEYSRINPACSNPIIKIRNNGREVLRNLKITYGLEGDQQFTHEWFGNLQSSKTQEIILPGKIISKEISAKFSVSLTNPNGKEDEYLLDNEMSSVTIQPPVYEKFILAFRTNKDSTSTSYKIKNSLGSTMKEINPGVLSPNTLYLDTFDLIPDCYTLTVTDTAGEGLDFWFNPEGGYGYVRLLDIEGKLIKSFVSDFGSTITHQFIVSDDLLTSFPNESLPIVNPFPMRNPGKFDLDIFFDQPEKVTLIVDNENGGRVYEQELGNFKEGIIPIDISSHPDGFYFVRVITKDGSVERKIKVKRDG